MQLKFWQENINITDEKPSSILLYREFMMALVLYRNQQLISWGEGREGIGLIPVLNRPVIELTF